MLISCSRFIVRDFKWDDSALEKQKKELAELEVEERELWVSFPECMDVITHR